MAVTASCKVYFENLRECRGFIGQLPDFSLAPTFHCSQNNTALPPYPSCFLQVYLFLSNSIFSCFLVLLFKNNIFQCNLFINYVNNPAINSIKINFLIFIRPEIISLLSFTLPCYQPLFIHLTTHLFLLVDSLFVLPPLFFSVSLFL